ncbi:DNA primase [Trichlorobacter lovleyi]|uniref:DNA primase n=1 Tax=Trichlorobacter lovleyi (strain ATCC BAA-1151 / DSM 17278 / SZ) TaxID=398767 RepID=B3E613_TRIL1|nr:DNA primase [Trichlorobacter lovleyi]ACD94737.1 DNA primase [Trichlorobacter lovleyi SZ]
MNRNDTVREVAERLSIAEIIGEYVSLKRSGSNFLGLCPFHGEKTPSFNVNPAREIFHCFGCGAGGDIFSFVMKIEGISFPEALRKLAARAGVAIEDRPLTDAEKQLKTERDQQRAIMLLTAQHYRETLTRQPEGAVARSYLQEREVDPETAAAYGLGYAPERRDTLIQLLRAKGLPLEQAEQLGIIRRGDRGWYDLLHHRLIFPIRDKQGQPIGFAGRVLDNSLPKYINSPESPLYRKSSVLFGVDLALRDIRQSGTAIIVEGYFDHLALYRAGIRNALATCGTALTDGHISLLKKHAQRVCLLFDGDNAGRKATVRAMELCLEQALPVYVINLPQGEDPDSLLQKHGVEAFNQRVAAAKPAFEQFLHWLLAKTPADSIDQRVRLMDEIIPRFQRIKDPVERDLYQKEICRLLGVDLQAFRRRLAGQRDQQQPVAQRQTATKPVTQTIARDSTQETMLGLLAAYPEARLEIRTLDLQQLFDQQHLPLAQAILAAGEGEHDGPLWPEVLARLEQEQQKELVARLLIQDQHLAGIDWRAALRQCLKRQKQGETRGLKQIALRLATLPEDSEEYQELLKTADQLRNQKSAL